MKWKRLLFVNAVLSVVVSVAAEDSRPEETAIARDSAVSLKEFLDGVTQARILNRNNPARMWESLAQLVKPGMTLLELFIALPPLESSLVRGELTIDSHTTYIVRYAVDGQYAVRASGEPSPPPWGPVRLYSSPEVGERWRMGVPEEPSLPKLLNDFRTRDITIRAGWSQDTSTR